MSLPAGFIDELRSRTSLAHVVGRKVTWDLRKSNQGRGDLWAPCPFHQEKTASFHVDDRKGFYFCFGCQAKGDMFDFVQHTENVGFMEAVEILAREAGMAMPAQDPAARGRADRHAGLVEVMEASVRYFRLQLSGGAGTAAREYLVRRHLPETARERFGIGYAPAARRGLWQHLTGQGLKPELIVESGMAIAPEDGGAPFDRFRDRIMFPIRDVRGRCIAFGGRAMSAAQQAKYLNSPDTPLFDKGRVLYNHGPARAAAGQGAALIVAEGYMDVIALNEAGFAGAVAPLGTAVTAEQLELLWRIAPEPVLALDGDAAGVKAAMRLVDVALPLLKAGRGLRVALLPEGKDPDELIRDRGAAAMQAALDAAQPMVELLWRRETEGRTFDSPDRRAALEARLADLTEKIADPVVKSHYRRALKDLQWTAFRPVPRRPRPGAPRGALAGPSAGARSSALATDDADAAETDLREAAILAAAIATPAVLDRCAEALADLPMRRDDHRDIRAALLAWHLRPTGSIRTHIEAEVGAEALENLFRRPHVALVPAVRAPGDAALAELCIVEELAKLEARRGLAAELSEACETFDPAAPDRQSWRLAQAVEARNRADRRQVDDRTVFETGPNGAMLSKDERNAFARLIRDIGLPQGKGSGTESDDQ
ncbi:MAG: DNA primase [Rhodobacteraceae bacterium]|nr:DNA primase [Paracoccaceae bacterium]